MSFRITSSATLDPPTSLLKGQIFRENDNSTVYEKMTSTITLLNSTQAANDALLLTAIKEGNTVLRILPYTGGSYNTLTMPALGSSSNEAENTLLRIFPGVLPNMAIRFYVTNMNTNNTTTLTLSATGTGGDSSVITIGATASAAAITAKSFLLRFTGTGTSVTGYSIVAA